MRHHGTLTAALAALLLAPAASAGTLTGKFVTPVYGPVANGTLLLTLSQAAIMPGSYAIVPASATCSTSSDGSVVGVPNPLAASTGSAFSAAGTLPAGIYFVQIGYLGAASTATLVSPELQLRLNAAGKLQVNPPTISPTAATGYAVYIGTASGAETLQGTSPLNAAYSQTTALANGSAPPTSNTTVCSLAFNWPDNGYISTSGSVVWS